jgi:hypothetical protein
MFLVPHSEACPMPSSMSRSVMDADAVPVFVGQSQVMLSCLIRPPRRSRPRFIVLRLFVSSAPTVLTAVVMHASTCRSLVPWSLVPASPLAIAMVQSALKVVMLAMHQSFLPLILCSSLVPAVVIGCNASPRPSFPVSKRVHVYRQLTSLRGWGYLQSSIGVDCPSNRPRTTFFCSCHWTIH